jgi:hypothetical protein
VAEQINRGLTKEGSEVSEPRLKNVPVSTMNGYGGNGGVTPVIPNLNFKMQVSSEFHSPVTSS